MSIETKELRAALVDSWDERIFDQLIERVKIGNIADQLHLIARAKVDKIIEIACPEFGHRLAKTHTRQEKEAFLKRELVELEGYRFYFSSGEPGGYDLNFYPEKFAHSPYKIELPFITAYKLAERRFDTRIICSTIFENSLWAILFPKLTAAQIVRRFAEQVMHGIAVSFAKNRISENVFPQHEKNDSLKYGNFFTSDEKGDQVIDVLKICGVIDENGSYQRQVLPYNRLNLLLSYLGDKSNGFTLDAAPTGKAKHDLAERLVNQEISSRTFEDLKPGKREKEYSDKIKEIISRLRDIE
ncbi:MAG: hypothetical protein HYZ15_13075 [Sphingobacteriales bacterium]|nr:hypothetical protein [Sphingobacteriales bacterium]